MKVELQSQFFFNTANCEMFFILQYLTAMLYPSVLCVKTRLGQSAGVWNLNHKCQSEKWSGDANTTVWKRICASYGR